jgi:outer membrane immunogenic protein
VPTTDTVGLDINWFGTARARAGYIADNTNLWYVTGGYAYGRTELALTSTNFVIPGVTANGITQKTTSGWTLGGGLESHLFGNWTAKLEYLYVDLGTIGGTAVAFIAPGVPAAAAISASAHVRDNIARAGLNYKF